MTLANLAYTRPILTRAELVECGFEVRTHWIPSRYPSSLAGCPLVAPLLVRDQWVVLDWCPEERPYVLFGSAQRHVASAYLPLACRVQVEAGVWDPQDGESENWRLIVSVGSDGENRYEWGRGTHLTARYHYHVGREPFSPSEIPETVRAAMLAAAEILMRE
jgi:hypothetical protein